MKTLSILTVAIDTNFRGLIEVARYVQQRIELQISKRPADVSAANVRRGGRLPGVFYGAGGENIQVDCNAKEFAQLGLGGGGAHLIRFASAEGSLNSNIALVKEIQTHPVQGTPIHVDFLRIDLSKPVQASIALHFVGSPPGVVEGGILQPLRRELEVRALPDKLPEHIEIDVSALNVHDSIHLEEVTFPEGVESMATENYAVVTVLPPVVEAEPEVDELEEGLEGAEGAEAASEDGEGGEKAGGAGDEKKEGD